MAAYRIKNFAGQVPKIDPREIAVNAAQDATNVFLTSGRIDPMFKPLQVAAAASAKVKTIYRLFNGASSVWLSWDAHVAIAASPVYIANNSRIAYASPDFEPRQTDLTLAYGVPPYPSNNYVLGVYAPTTKPALTGVSGGSGVVEDRSYVYTFVTQWGEESAPSPAMDLASGYANGSWNVSVPDIAPHNSYNISAAVHSSGVVEITLDTVFGLRALETVTINGVVSGMTDLNGTFRIQAVNSATNKATILLSTAQVYTSGGVATRAAPHNTSGMLKRVYRTVTTSSGTEYYQVGVDIAVSTSTISDGYTDVGSQLVTSGWAMPPASLQGVVTHPSGAMVGFVGNQIYMSMPYSIYAWPITQTNTIDFNIIGLGVFGQTIAVVTDGHPYTITFTDPAAATPQKLGKDWPCLATRGIEVFNEGVFYPTNLGLVYIGSMGANLISEQYYSQRDWEQLKPSTFISCHYDDRYYAAFDDGVAPKVLIFSKSEGITFLNLQPTAMATDGQDGQAYAAVAGFISKLNADSGILMPYSWRSKEFVEPSPINLGACKVDFNGEVSPDVEKAIIDKNTAAVAANNSVLASSVGSLGPVNGAIGNLYTVGGSSLTDLLSTATSGRYISVSLYANGVLQFTKKVTDTNVWRFPAGRKYDNYSIGITGTAPVKAVSVGGTPMELKNV